MTKIRLILISLIGAIVSAPVFAQPSGLQIYINDQNQPVIHHTLEQGQTIYGISKSYNADLDALVAMLPESKVDELKIGQDITVPIDKHQICYRQNDCAGSLRIPVYYKIQRQDNLFRIARIYFDSTVEQLKLLNGMKNSLLDNGSFLTIGWLPYRDEWQSYLSPQQMEAIVQVTPQDVEIREDEQTVALEDQPVLLTMNEGPQNEVNSILEGIGSRNEHHNARIFADDYTETPEFNTEHKALITQGATAYWNKNQSSKKGFYILHKTLPVESYIQIMNPVTHQTVLAKVVGKIPDNIYSPEISLVVTTEVAEALGAIDKKFYTRITYPEMN